MRRILLLVAAGALAGCGSDAPSSVDAFIHQIAVQQCAWEFRCCTDSEIQQQDGRKFSTQDGCVPYHELALEDELYVNRLAAKQGRLKLDHDKAQACEAAMMMQACNPKPGQPAHMPSMGDDPCKDVFVGATPAGQPCQLAIECEQGSHCVTDQLTPGSGVCVPYQHEGDICNDDSDCDPMVKQLYCAKQDYKCHVRAHVGEPCAYSKDAAGQPTLPLLLECDDTVGNTYCDPVTSTCKQLPGAGQPCLSPLPPGVTSSCDPDPTLHLTCRTTAGSTSGICTGLAKDGQDCSEVACDTGLYCDTSGTGYVCRPLPGLGQPCTSSGQCLAPYFCNYARSPYTCDQPAQLGQPCTNGTTCDVHLWCDTTQPTPVCKSQLADGQPCTGDEQCASDSCSVTLPRVCNPSQQPGAILCVGR